MQTADSARILSSAMYPYISRHCPICLESDISSPHIASHLQRIAIFALPRIEDPEDDGGSWNSSASTSRAANMGEDDLSSTGSNSVKDSDTSASNVTPKVPITREAVEKIPEQDVVSGSDILSRYLDNTEPFESLSLHEHIDLTEITEGYLTPNAGEITDGSGQTSNASQFNQMLAQNNQSQQQTRLENMEMQRQPFRNELESKAKRDATS